jgi:four helix bundle protein
MKKYERLEAWRAAHKLAMAVYRATESFPRTELYGLTSQMRRAALSVPANIAEGSARRGSAEFRRYLDIALGSLSELSYYLLFSREMGFLRDERHSAVEQLRVGAAKLTWALYAVVAEHARQRPRPAAGR